MGQRIGRGRLASPATTPVFAPGLAEDEPSPDVPPGTVPGLFCSLPPGAVLFGLGCVTIALRAVHQKGRQPLRAWSLYASFSLPVSLIAVRPADAAEIHVRSRQRGCLHYARGSRLSYRPGQYVAERIIVAFISALSLTVIAISDFSNRMVEKNLVAIAAYVLLPALAATAWLRTCHPMADSATRNLRWIFGAAARYEASLESVQSLGKRISQLR